MKYINSEKVIASVNSHVLFYVLVRFMVLTSNVCRVHSMSLQNDNGQKYFLGWQYLNQDKFGQFSKNTGVLKNVLLKKYK